MNFLSKEVQSILVQAAKNIVLEAQSNLENGDLRNSLKYKERDGSIDIIMNEYGIYQDKGVSGANKSDFEGRKKKVHQSTSTFKFSGAFKAIGGSSSIAKFIKRKGISSNLYDKGTLNFLIRRSIYQHGIKPTLFLTKPYEKYREQIIEEFNNLHEQIKKDIDNGDNK